MINNEVISLLLPVLSCATAAVSIAAVFFGLFQYFRRRSRQDIVYENSAFFLAMASLLTFSGIIIRRVLLGQWRFTLMPSLFCLLSLAWLVSWYNEVVIFTEEGFTRRSYLGRSRFYRYSDLTDISKRTLREGRYRKEVQMLFCMGNERFFLPCKAINYDRFIECIRKHGRKGIAP